MSLLDYILGDDAASREYIVRHAPPRFIARVVSDGAGDAYDPAGLTLRIDDDQSLAEFQWIDDPPDDRALLEIASEVLQFLIHREEVEERSVEALEEDDDLG